MRSSLASVLLQYNVQANLCLVIGAGAAINVEV